VFFCVCFLYQFSQRCYLILIDHNTVNSSTLNCFTDCFLERAVKFEIKLLDLVLHSECAYIFQFFKFIHNMLSNKNDIRIAILDLKHRIVDKTRVLILLFEQIELFFRTSSEKLHIFKQTLGHFSQSVDSILDVLNVLLQDRFAGLLLHFQSSA